MHFLNQKQGKRGIIFCKTKAAVNKLAKNLAINKFSSGALHGSLSQGIRDRIMGQFREGHIDILVATDLAARGIDVKEVAYVVNYHLARHLRGVCASEVGERQEPAHRGYP